MSIFRSVLDKAGFDIGRTNERNRQKWLATTLAGLPHGARILDAGAGELRNKPLCSHLQYVSQDFCQYAGSAEVGLRTERWDTSKIDIVSDICAIPQPDRSFDVILCSEVLEHVPDPVMAIKELSRLLRPGGTLIVTAPFCSITHMAPFHYSTGFTRYWYQQHLEAHGFDIEELQANGSWFQYVAQELWRLPQVGDEYARKGSGWVALVAGLPLIAALGVLDRTKRGHASSEVLSFGWHVVAKRR